jgi:hypothetical protein
LVGGEVHAAAAEVLVFEVHIVLLLDHLDHLIELVHVELADEGGEVPVPEEVRQHLVLQLLGVLYQDLVLSVPRQVLAVLSLLSQVPPTSRM